MDAYSRRDRARSRSSLVIAVVTLSLQAAVLSACGGSGSPDGRPVKARFSGPRKSVANPGACDAVDSAVIGRVAAGLRKDAQVVVSKAAVAIVDPTPQFHLTAAIAVRVSTSDGVRHEDVVLAAANADANGGLILAGSDALNYFTFGSAVSPGSPLASERDELLSSPAANSAMACLGVPH